MHEQRLAVGRHRDRMGIAHEQPPADALLETTDVFADARLVELSCRPASVKLRQFVTVANVLSQTGLSMAHCHRHYR